MTDEPETHEGVKNVTGLPANNGHETTLRELDDVVRRSKHGDKCQKTVYP
jgi:hypothetical protein